MSDLEIPDRAIDILNDRMLIVELEDAARIIVAAELRRIQSVLLAEGSYSLPDRANELDPEGAS